MRFHVTSMRDENAKRFLHHAKRFLHQRSLLKQPRQARFLPKGRYSLTGIASRLGSFEMTGSLIYSILSEEHLIIG